MSARPPLPMFRGDCHLCGHPLSARSIGALMFAEQAHLDYHAVRQPGLIPFNPPSLVLPGVSQ